MMITKYTILRALIYISSLAALLVIASPYASLGFVLGTFFAVGLSLVSSAERTRAARLQHEAVMAEIGKVAITLENWPVVNERPSNPLVRH